VATAIAALWMPTAAAGGEEHAAKTSTFSGSCQFEGVVSFDPPLGPARQETRADAAAAGPCSGTWRHGGRTWQLDGARVRYRATSFGTQSCDSAEASGEGFLAYRHRRLRFSFAESRVLTSAPIHLEGAAGGAFDGTATATGDPAATVAACAGDGVAESPISIEGETDPEISG
jgi:hypothetical protein